MSRKKILGTRNGDHGETHEQDANDDIWGGNVSILSAFHLFPVPPLLQLIF